MPAKHQGLPAKGLAHMLGREYGRRRPIRQQLAVEKQHQLKTLHGQAQVVGRHKYGQPLPAQIVQQPQHRLLCRRIHAGKRLVHQQDMRLLCQGARQKHTLLLPARQVADRALGEVGDPHVIQRRRHRRAVPFACTAEITLARKTTHHHDI